METDRDIFLSIAELRRRYATPVTGTSAEPLSAFDLRCFRRNGIEHLFGDADGPPEPDLLSIDVDGQDYRVWDTLKGWRQRIALERR